MTKAELQAHRDEYDALVVRAKAAEELGLLRKAVEYGLAAWVHIDGMIQFARRYESQETVAVEAIDLVLIYAPALLDFTSLSTLETLLKTHKRIEKGSGDDLSDRLKIATAEMWDAHRMWAYLEANPGATFKQACSSLGGDAKRWQRFAKLWARMGLLHRSGENSQCLSFSTRLGAVVPAKCRYCGDIAEAPKAMFLEPVGCTVCGKTSFFVFVAEKQTLQTGA